MRLVAMRRMRNGIDVRGCVRNRINVVAMSIVIDVRLRVRHVIDVCRRIGGAIRRLNSIWKAVIGSVSTAVLRLAILDHRTSALVGNAVVVRPIVIDRVDVGGRVGHRVQVISVAVVIDVRLRMWHVVNVPPLRSGLLACDQHG